ncbi:MAG TPA: N-methyl-L-tryptophan oxidase [Streptosporangiaceae bacterium]
MQHTVDTDVVVVGLGAMGSMALWRLAERGVRAVGVEQFAPGHTRGSSHGGSRIFRVAVFEGAAYVPVAQLAHRLWRELEHDSGEELLISTGALMFGPPDSHVVAGSRRAIEDFGLPHERFDDAEQMRRRWPQFAFADSDVGLLDRDGGALRPERAIRAACREAARLGAEILPSAAALSVDADGGGVRVDTGATVIRADRAVVAVGAWTNQLLPEAGLPLEIRRAVMTWFSGTPAELYRPDRLPVFVSGGSRPGDRAGADGAGADGPADDRAGDAAGGGWGVPDVDGLGLKLGHHDPSAARRLARAEDNSPVVASGETEPSSAVCRATFPGLDPRPAHVQVCLTTHSPDQDFVVGPLPGAEQVTLLAGFSGHGFKHAAGLGEIAAQLIADGGSAYDLSPFRPDRFARAPGAGAVS